MREILSYFLVFCLSFVSLELRAQAEEPIYRAVEEMPQFGQCQDAPGKGKLDKCSEKELLRFFYAEFNPTKATYSRISLSFVIEKDGSIGHLKYLRDYDEPFKKEIARVIQMMNDKKEYHWRAGKHNGELARVRYLLSVIICFE